MAWHNQKLHKLIYLSNAAKVVRLGWQMPAIKSFCKNRVANFAPKLSLAFDDDRGKYLFE
jgi:hypothetical protein